MYIFYYYYIFFMWVAAAEIVTPSDLWAYICVRKKRRGAIWHYKGHQMIQKCWYIIHIRQSITFNVKPQAVRKVKTVVGLYMMRRF